MVLLSVTDTDSGLQLQLWLQQMCKAGTDSAFLTITDGIALCQRHHRHQCYHLGDG